MYPNKKRDEAIRLTCSAVQWNGNDLQLSHCAAANGTLRHRTEHMMEASGFNTPAHMTHMAGNTNPD